MDFTDFSFDTITTMVNKVKNAVMQYTEFEIKVREATSNESCKSRLVLSTPTTQ